MDGRRDGNRGGRRGGMVAASGEKTGGAKRRTRAKKKAVVHGMFPELHGMGSANHRLGITYSANRVAGAPVKPRL